MTLDEFLAAEAERLAWLETCTDTDRAVLLGYLAGWDPAVFDRARAFVERIRRAAASA